MRLPEWINRLLLSLSLYLRTDDMHWSPAGQDLAARIVADTVATRGLLRR